MKIYRHLVAGLAFLAALIVATAADAAPAYYTPTPTIAALQAYGTASPSVIHADVVGYQAGTAAGGARFDWITGACIPDGANWFAATGVPTSGAGAGCWRNTALFGQAATSANIVLPAANNCIGNSFIDGSGGTPPCIFAAANLGKAFTSYGIPGQVISQIAIRQGGGAITATVSGNTITNSANSVTALNGTAIVGANTGVTPNQFLTTPADNATRTVTGTLCGRVGVMTRTATGGPSSTAEVYTFTPGSSSGLPVSCAANSVFAIDTGTLNSGIVVMEGGYNDAQGNVPLATAKAGISAMVAHLGGTATASISQNVLTVTVPPTNSKIFVGYAITGAGVQSGTYVTALGTGTGGTGTYLVNNPQTVTSGTLTIANDKYLILPTSTGSGEPSGNARYTYITDLNNWESVTFPGHYTDTREWIIRYGLAALNITPTSQDLIDIANDTTPTSLRADSIHYNTNGYFLQGGQISNYAAGTLFNGSSTIITPANFLSVFASPPGLGSSNPSTVFATNISGGAVGTSFTINTLTTSNHNMVINAGSGGDLFLNLTEGANSVKIGDGAGSVVSSINKFGEGVFTKINGNVITTGTGTLTLGSATLNVGAGGTLGSNAFTSTAYVPKSGTTMTAGASIFFTGTSASPLEFIRMSNTNAAGSKMTWENGGSLVGQVRNFNSGSAWVTSIGSFGFMDMISMSGGVVTFGAQPASSGASDQTMCMSAAGVITISTAACTGISSKLFKTGFAPLTHGLDWVDRLAKTEMSWRWKADQGYRANKASLGPLAEDLKAIDKRLVIDDGGKLAPDDHAMLAVLTMAIHQLHDKSDAQQREIETLKRIPANDNLWDHLKRAMGF